MRKYISALISIFILCIIFFAIARAGEKNRFNSIDIEESLLLGHEMKSIEGKFGRAKFVKGFSNAHKKIFTREEWDKYAWELYFGHYLYRFKRNNNEVQYSVSYTTDSSKSKFHPVERVLRISIIFDKPPTINELSLLIPEIKLFDNKKIRTFIHNSLYLNETQILYLANPSVAAGLIASGFEKKVDGYGFSIKITLEKKSQNPDELSKVKDVSIDVSSTSKKFIKTIGYQPTKFIKLSKDTNKILP